MLITVFTPTYNRAHLLNELYQSLINQINSPTFEWLVIDDGSTDNTEQLISKFIAEERMKIRYYKQNNGGKHRAINKGAKLAHGKFFFIVDSDDLLTEDALEFVQDKYSLILNKNDCAGFAGLKILKNRQNIVTNMKEDSYYCSTVDFRYKYCIKGDIAEIYLTQILKKFPFPNFDGEFFCPESLVWNRIAQKYNMYFFKKPIYICEYLDGGLSSLSLQNRIKSPSYARVIYSEFLVLNAPFFEKIKSCINYWRFTLHAGFEQKTEIKTLPIISLIVFPISFLLYLKDKVNV